MTDAIPARVRVRMYQVGFGDCFLVSFEYDAPVDGRADRHILFDFGSVRRPRQGRGDPAAVARLIAQHTGGKLDAVVVTHRHKDHLSGFAHQVAGQILDGLEPRMVVRSWTEKPDEAPSAGSALRGDHEVPTDLQGGSPQTSPSAGSAGGSPQTS